MTKVLCELCGEPMPEGETMFKFHGYSGECPKPPIQKKVQDGVPDGYVLLPKIPTHESIKAIRLMLPATKQFDDEVWSVSIYKALVEANNG